MTAPEHVEPGEEGTVQALVGDSNLSAWVTGLCTRATTHHTGSDDDKDDELGETPVSVVRDLEEDDLQTDVVSAQVEAA